MGGVSVGAILVGGGVALAAMALRGFDGVEEVRLPTSAVRIPGRSGPMGRVAARGTQAVAYTFERLEDYEAHERELAKGGDADGWSMVAASTARRLPTGTAVEVLLDRGSATGVRVRVLEGEALDALLWVRHDQVKSPDWRPIGSGRAPTVAAQPPTATPPARPPPTRLQTLSEGAAAGRAAFDDLVARYRKLKWAEAAAEIGRQCQKEDCNDTSLEAMIAAQPSMRSQIDTARNGVIRYTRSEPIVACAGPWVGGFFETSCACRLRTDAECCPRGKSGGHFQPSGCTR